MYLTIVSTFAMQFWACGAMSYWQWRPWTNESPVRRVILSAAWIGVLGIALGRWTATQAYGPIAPKERV